MNISKAKIKIISIVLTVTCLFTFNAVPVFAAVSYIYDANGNMTSDSTNCYTYNEANRLSQVKNCSTNQLVAEYYYDDQGTRVKEKEYTNGTLAYTIYNPTKDYETKKLADNSTQNTTYYHGNGQILARKNPDGSKTYYQNDHLGSTGLLTNQSGSTVETTSYYPYGQVRSGGTQSKYLFTGKQNDTETGLTYFEARYYDSHIQRFAQPDTYTQNIYNPQDLNEYSYVLNNPLRYIDPTGHLYEILAYNNALNSYNSKPSVTSYNNVLSTIASIQKSTKSTSSSSLSGGSKGGGTSSGSGSNGSTSLARDTSQAIDLYKSLYSNLWGNDYRTFINQRASLTQRGLAGVGLLGSVVLPETEIFKAPKAIEGAIDFEKALDAGDEIKGGARAGEFQFSQLNPGRVDEYHGISLDGTSEGIFRKDVEGNRLYSHTVWKDGEVVYQRDQFEREIINLPK